MVNIISHSCPRCNSYSLYKYGKESLVIKNTNAVNANINLHLILFQVVQEVQNHFRRSKENILLAPLAVNLHFFITITTIILIIVARIKNAIIRSFKLNLL